MKKNPQLSDKSPRTQAKSIVALVLTFVAGYVDIVGALTVYNVFTAHMTGTTVRLGQQLVQRNWNAVAVGVIVIAAFIVGSVVGRAIIEAGSRLKIRHIGSITLALETLLLAALIPVGTQSLYVTASHAPSVRILCILLGVLAFAMGLQTATLTRIGPLTVHTTFVTGMLNKLAQLISHYLFYTYDLLNKSSHLEKAHLLTLRNAVARQARFIFAIWVVYLAGAACGTWLGLRWQLQSFYLPCCLLIGSVIVEQIEPLSLEEEQDQSER